MWNARSGAGLVAGAGGARWYRGEFCVRIAALSLLIAAASVATSARADCTPAAGNNVTATCTGTTTNQGANAPPSSTGVDGYGSGVETGVTVNVSNGASITGNNNGINVGDVTVNNGTGATISGVASNGIAAETGAATVTNSGTISGQSTSGAGISAQTSASVTNNAGASITGNTGIAANTGPVTVSNFGTISGNGPGGLGIISIKTATVTNSAGATIAGTFSGIQANGGNVTNFGTITGGSGEGIEAPTGATTVINGQGGSISGRAGVQAEVVFNATGTLNVTNSGSITGTVNDGVFSGTSLTVTNNAGGSITGANQAIAADVGGSSVYNAGSISGTNFAILFAGTGNTLTLATSSVISGLVMGAGADTLQLGGSGAATFDASQLGSASGLQYQGFGTLNKIDSSVWTLTGTSPYAGAVNVIGGTLVVDGNISAASGVTVNAGGTLAGTGTVSTTTINGGTLAPGDNGAGVLSAKGSLALTAASTYLLQISGAANTSVNVTGTATPGGATVDAVFTGKFISKQYAILTAAGGVAGTFAPGVVTMNLPSNFSASLGYDATHAYINISAPYRSGLDGNQRAVANALDNGFNSNGGIPLTLGALNAAGLTQASGETATGAQQTTFDAMGQFMGLLTDPFMGRGGGINSPTPAPGYADEEGASAYAATRRLAQERDAYAMFTKAPLANVYEPRWSVWASGFGGSQSTDGNAAAGSNNTASSIAGTAVGADYLFSPNTLAGFALAGGGTSFAVANGGSGRSDLFQAGAYVRHTNGPFYVSAALAYGWQDITTDRTVAGLDLLRAEFNANAWSGRVEGGYRFVAPWTGGIGITPYAAAQFVTFDLPAYAEQAIAGSSDFALAYGARDVTDGRSELGLRTDKSFAMTDGILTLRGRLAWEHDYDPDRSIAATFQALPGASFVVNGAAQASDSALTTASIEIKWMNGWSAAATFEGEFSDVTQSYAGRGVVRYAW
jgi:uncharacterized protein with beta-barrel porin domain